MARAEPAAPPVPDKSAGKVPPRRSGRRRAGGDDIALEAPKVRSGVQAALEAVRQWRRDAEAGSVDTLRKLEAEAKALQEQLDLLNAAIADNASARDQLVIDQDRLDRDHDRRLHEALGSAFARDATALARRASQVTGEEARRRQVLDKALSGHDDIRAIADELDRFADVDLDSLPASYREAITRHHANQATRLRTFLAEHDPGLEGLEGADVLPLDLAWTVQEADGLVTVRLLTPVPATVADGGSEVSSLESTVWAYAVEAMLRALAALGSPTARLRRVTAGSLAGLHAVVPAPPRIDIDHAVSAALEGVFLKAPPLTEACVQVTPVRIGVDPLAPPPDPADDPVTEEIGNDLELEVDDGG